MRGAATRALAAVAPHGVTIAVAVATVGLSFNSGSFGVTVRNPIAIGIWWALVLAVGTLLWPLARTPRAAWIGGGLLAAYAALMGISTVWAPSAENAFAEFNRTAAYAGVFALVVLASRRGSLRRWSDGIAIGIAAVALIALVVRLFPQSFPSAHNSPFFALDSRPSYPLGYWNALAVMLAIGMGPMLRIATAARSAAARGLAVASLPVFYATLNLTGSRGGAVAAVVCAVVFMLATSARTRALAALVSAAAGSVMVSLVLDPRPLITGYSFLTDAAVPQGHSAALLIALAAVGAGALYLVIERFVPDSVHVPRNARRAALAVAAVALVALAVAANPSQRFESFKQPPGNLDSALLSSEGNGRWQLWTAAVNEFGANPVVGGGGGSFQYWWAEHADISYFTRYAHSLYLESLAELGPLGLLIILSIVGLAIVTGRRRAREQTGEGRVAVAGVAAGLAAFGAAAGIDWVWQLTAVGAIAVALLALLLGPASEPADASGRPDPFHDPRTRLTFERWSVIILGMAIMASLAVPWLAERSLGQSRDAAARGDLAAAIDKADSARSLEPWAASPQLQVALVRQAQGRLADARHAIELAIRANPEDWRTWLISSQIARASGRPGAANELFAHARSLNPKSPLFQR